MPLGYLGLRVAVRGPPDEEKKVLPRISFRLAS